MPKNELQDLKDHAPVLKAKVISNRELRNKALAIATCKQSRLQADMEMAVHIAEFVVRQVQTEAIRKRTKAFLARLAVKPQSIHIASRLTYPVYQNPPVYEHSVESHPRYS